MISIIMPVYNGSLFIKEAIGSVFRQNFDELEILVIDDGSTDNTKEIVGSLSHPSIKYIYQENGGPSKARNTGIRNSSHNLIAFLDADDTWPLDKLRSQFLFLTNNDSVDVVTGLTEYVFSRGSEERKIDYTNVNDPVFNVQLGAMLVRKKVIDTIGYFDESLRFSHDQDWLLRMRENNISVRIIQEVALHYRIHPGNITKNKRIKDLEILKVLKLSLERRRNAGIHVLNNL